MQIQNITAGRSDLLPSGRRTDPADAADALAAADAASAGASGPSPSSVVSLRAIMTNYDVGEISPQQFSEMLQKLHESGAIGDGDLRELAVLRMEMDEARIEPDQQVNLLDKCIDKLKQLEEKLKSLEKDPQKNAAEISQVKQALAGAQRRYDWLQKLALVHASPDAVGMDAVA